MDTPHLNKRIEKLIFCMLFFAGAYFYQPIDYDNTSSRYFLISSVVDFNTLNIDNYRDTTDDTSFFNGHYYSNKAIGVPLIGIPVYWALRNLTPLGEKPPLSSIEKYFVRILTTTLPYALLGVILFRFACGMGANIISSLWMTIAYSFGSIAFSHATLLSGHQVAGSFAFFSFAILFNLSRKDDPDGSENRHLFLMLHSFLAGLFAGIAALADYTAMFIAAALTIYAVSLRLHREQMASFLFGGGLTAATLAVYNYICFGNPWSMSYAHNTYKLFQEGSAKGLLGVSGPDPFALLSILVSPSRGLFFIMPVFFFSFIGLHVLWKKDIFQREIVLIISIVAGYFLINAGFYGWHGGWTFGPRYLVPMLPFLALPMAFISWNSIWAYIVLGLSIFQVTLSVIGIPHIPPEIQNPITEFILPFLGYGYMAINGGSLIGLQHPWSVLPFFVATGVFMFFIFRGIKRKVAATKLSYCSSKQIENSSQKENILRRNSIDKKEQGSEVSLLWKVSTVLWLSCILVMLAAARTEPEKMVHAFRAKLLYPAAAVTRSERLYNMAVYEEKLAALKPLQENTEKKEKRQ